MKKASVIQGGLYYTRVGGRLVQVMVTGSHDNHTGRTVFTLKRTDNGKPLQKPRAPSALHTADDVHKNRLRAHAGLDE